MGGKASRESSIRSRAWRWDLVGLCAMAVSPFDGTGVRRAPTRRAGLSLHEGCGMLWKTSG